MHQIRQISQRMLQEKLKENHATEMEGERKKDIMSLLVRGRKESLASEPSGYTLSDEAMMDQVVRVFFFSCYCFALKQHFVKLTFLGAGHETTASGLAWVSRSGSLFFFSLRKNLTIIQTLYLLAVNKEAQDKLRAEVTPVLEVNPRPEYRTLKELQWLDHVMYGLILHRI